MIAASAKEILSQRSQDLEERPPVYFPGSQPIQYNIYQFLTLSVEAKLLLNHLPGLEHLGARYNAEHVTLNPLLNPHNIAVRQVLLLPFSLYRWSGSQKNKWLTKSAQPVTDWDWDMFGDTVLECLRESTFCMSQSPFNGSSLTARGVRSPHSSHSYFNTHFEDSCLGATPMGPFSLCHLWSNLL